MNYLKKIAVIIAFSPALLGMQEQKIEHYIQNIIKSMAPTTTEGVTLTKRFLEELHTYLRKNPSNATTLTKALEDAQSIKNFSLSPEYKAEITQSQIYGTINLEQFANTILNTIIQNLEQELQTIKRHTQSFPVGLKNVYPSNRCFMNAAIQCLYSMPALTQALLKQANTQLYKSSSMTANYIELLKLLASTSEEDIDPIPFCIQVWESMKQDPATQQDAVEFIQLLFNHMITEDIQTGKENKEIEDLLTFVTRSHIIEQAHPLQHMPLQDLTEYYPELQNIFKNYPELQQTYLLADPMKILEKLPLEELIKKYPLLYNFAQEYPEFIRLIRRPTTSKLTILPLTLQSRYKTLDDSLTAFFSPEEITIQQTSKAFKITRLHQSSTYFCISLKRNIYNSATKTYYKDETPISFPLDTLDVTPYSDKTTALPKYELIACLIHSGSATGGHYTAYVKRKNNWYLCNDEIITPVTKAQMDTIAARGYGENLHQTPVMFIYQAKQS